MASIRIKTIIKFILICVPFFSFAQDYTWIKGSNLSLQAGVYGTMGIPGPNNNPTPRHSSVGWKDNSGNLWLFGGMFFLNDLWKYDLLSNQWVWVRGSNTANQYGTYGTPGVSSPANEPGNRMGACTWTDLSGNLWMFGGSGVVMSSSNGVYLNDLWKYNVLTNEWTWMNGSSTPDQTGVYGVQGTPSATNKPGGRSFASCWTDLSGNLWMFGGGGYSSNYAGYLNDLWKYDIASNQWTWMKGSNTANQNGVYNTIGVSGMPGARQITSHGSDASGNFYLFGGDGYDVTAVPGILNDLWKYSVQTNQWTWISGSNIKNQTGNYGIQGAASPANQPGSRFGAYTWMDDADNIFLFGGGGYTAGPYGFLNDLWKYSISTNQWVWLKGSSNTDQPGNYGTIGLSSALSTPGARQRGVSWIDNNKNLWLFGGIGFSSDTTLGGPLSDLWSFSCSSNPTVSISSAGSAICAGQSATLSASGAYSYSWSSPSQFSNTLITVSPTVSTSYTVTGYDVYGCRNSSSVTQDVELCTGFGSKRNLELQFLLYPNPTSGELNISQQLPDHSAIKILNVFGENVLNVEIENTERIKVDLPNGVYLYEIVWVNGSMYSGKFIIAK